MSLELSKEWDKVCEKIDKRDQGANELAKLREEVGRLSRGKNEVSSIEATVKPTLDVDVVDKLKREQEEARVVADRRFAMMEEKIVALIKGKEEAEANVELWKAEAHRPGSKRGNIVVCTPATEARVRPRNASVVRTASTSAGMARTEGRADPVIKGIVERHQMEINVLKELRLKDVGGRIEAEKEVERLKEAMVRLEMEKRQKGTNLNSRLDEAAGPSTYKPPCPPTVEEEG
ncbi:hypothetical protein CBR_g30557 [Chara braunii]|uniref:Uncharacterized protein n=1 Tax=Chara braunii TaxID=69332 RepID=A0A388LD03_CHABU|nr:hypothetical protein CBR_g30557 [Chara braunii]|eukprot:GBG80191.1 hypothetical protein CBR_g30557 [Chara braunii]